MCTDYLKKWPKIKAIKAVTEEKVADFLRENIFYKFGYLREWVIRSSTRIPPLTIHKPIGKWRSLTEHWKGSFPR